MPGRPAVKLITGYFDITDDRRYNYSVEKSRDSEVAEVRRKQQRRLRRRNERRVNILPTLADLRVRGRTADGQAIRIGDRLYYLFQYTSTKVWTIKLMDVEDAKRNCTKGKVWYQDGCSRSSWRM